MKRQTIIRVQKNRNFSVISNVHLNDTRLSWKAKGLLTYLLSRPDDWTLITEYLVKQSKDGRDATLAGINELVASDYIKKSKLRDKKGIIRGVEYLVVENPGVPEAESTETGPSHPEPDFPDTGKPDTGKPDTGNPTLLNTEVTNTDLPKTDDDVGTPQALSQASPSVPSSSPSFFLEIQGLIPKNKAKPSVLKTLREHIGKGEGILKKAVLFTNNYPMKKDTWQSYKGFLGRCLESFDNGDFWADGYEPEACTPDNKTPIIPKTGKIRMPDGKIYRLNEGFVYMKTGCVSPGALLKLVEQGKAEIVKAA